MHLSQHQNQFFEYTQKYNSEDFCHAEMLEGSVILAFPDDQAMAKAVGRFMIDSLIKNPAGVITSTGGTPRPTFLEMRAYLKELQKRNGSDLQPLQEAVADAQDEYLGVHSTDSHSYITETRRNLSEIFLLRNVLAPRGWWPNMRYDRNGKPEIPAEIKNGWEQYDQTVIENARYALFGIGPPDDPHIGFNMVGTDDKSHIHLTELAEATREANARFFNNDITQVPHYAVTLGIGTYLEAMRKPEFESAFIMANAKEKALSLFKTLTGKPETAPGGYLRADPVTNEKLLFVMTSEVYTDLQNLLRENVF